MLHTKMCNFKIYVTHAYEMCSIRTYENVICPDVCYTRKYALCQKCVMLETVTHGNMMSRAQCPSICYTRKYEMFSVRTYVTYEHIVCPNLYYTRKYDIWCPNLYHIRKSIMFKPMLHTKISYLVSKPCYIQNV